MNVMFVADCEPPAILSLHFAIAKYNSDASFVWQAVQLKLSHSCKLSNVCICMSVHIDTSKFWTQTATLSIVMKGVYIGNRPLWAL